MMNFFTDLKRKLGYLKETKTKLKEKVGGADTDTFRQLAEKVEMPKKSRVDFEDLADRGQRATFIGLSKVPVPETVTEAVIQEGTEIIGIGLFSMCTKLKSVSLPDSLTVISNYAFMMCASLTSITLPESVTRIGGYSFAGCTSLTSITLPESVAYIIDFAFGGCSSLKEVIFKSTPTSIETRVFLSSFALTSIKVPWSEGAVSGAPWGATNATITYDYKGE